MILYLSILSLLDLSALAIYIYSLLKHQKHLEEYTHKIEDLLLDYHKIKSELEAYSNSPIAQNIEESISSYFDKINSLLREKKSLVSEPREE